MNLASSKRFLGLISHFPRPTTIRKHSTNNAFGNWKSFIIGTNITRTNNNNKCIVVINSSLLRFQSTTINALENRGSGENLKKQDEFPLDISNLVNTLPPGPPRILGKALLDLWIERLTVISRSGKVNIAEADLDWEGISNKCREMDFAITKANIGGLIMNNCLKYSSYTVAQNYMKQEQSPSLAVLTNFIRLIAENPKECGGEEAIIKVYKRIKAKNRNKWDLDSGERTIIAICQTKLWKDSIAIVESMSVGGSVSLSCYAAIVRTAFENGEPELAWKILTEQSHRGLLADGPFIAFLQTCEPTEENMKKLLEFTHLHEQYGGDSLVAAIKDYFISKLGYKGRNAKIVSTNHDGTVVCGSCKTPLRSTELSEKVLETEDLFMNTTPEELMAYKEFVEDTAPYDFVLDGLNVAFCKGKSNDGAAVLRDVVLHLNKMRAKILLIGRKHMGMRSVKHINHLRRMSRFFLINNESKDDPFIIWAALKSGPHTQFISNNMMRNHPFRLKDPEVARLFKRWRLSQQIGVHVDYRGKVILNPFTEMPPVPQKNPENCYLHIPLDLDSRSPYDIPKNWFCLEPPPKK